MEELSNRCQGQSFCCLSAKKLSHNTINNENGTFILHSKVNISVQLWKSIQE